MKGKSGRARKIDIEGFKGEYVSLILEPALAGECHWTGIKFHGHLKKEYQEELGYSMLLRYLSERVT
ncbi:MAG: hypothetical protein GYA55_03370 [SAR324 cluster bacterium]|uniref:Uncharacterized protein n=1 Tax=SAR324 cluster bacterium TaxID=2024889 RepID=A0A7X9IJ20_9DELT|nr:hypothetical protein [SAR324 cluster bacterium]